MSRFLVSALGAAVLLSAGMAFAGQPDPGQSSGDDRIGVSPKNLTVDPTADYEFEFFLRDSGGQGVEGWPASQVQLDFLNCASPSTRPQSQIPADGPSNVDGRVVWRIGLTFGGSDPCAVDVLVQGLPFATIPGDPGGGGVRSPDEDGNGFVALADLSRFQQAFVNGVPIYEGDLLLDNDTAALADLSVFQKHFVAP